MPQPDNIADQHPLEVIHGLVGLAVIGSTRRAFSKLGHMCHTGASFSAMEYLVTISSVCIFFNVMLKSILSLYCRISHYITSAVYTRKFCYWHLLGRMFRRMTLKVMLYSKGHCETHMLFEKKMKCTQYDLGRNISRQKSFFQIQRFCTKFIRIVCCM